MALEELQADNRVRGASRAAQPQTAGAHIDPQGTLAGGDGDLTGRSFLLVGGDRLTVAVARRFLSRGAELTILAPQTAAFERLMATLGRLPGVRITDCHANLRAQVEQAAPGAECVLALSDESELNVQVAIYADRIGLPVVLRAFDPGLAETVEQKITNVRRAYSMAHLSAPFFVACALLGSENANTNSGYGNVLTMRAGADYVVVCHVPVPEASGTGRGRRLTGNAPAALADRTGCHVVARRPDHSADWRSPTAGEQQDVLAPHEEILLAGPAGDIFRVLRDNYARPRTHRRRPTMPRPRRRLDWDRLGTALGHVSARWVKCLLAMFLVLTAVVVIAPRGDVADRVYTWVSTALGNTENVSGVSKGTELLLAVGLLAGGVAFGLAICLGATFLIERRMTELMERRMRRLADHIVVVGLNEVAFRVTEMLIGLGIDCAVVDPHPEIEDTAAVRYVSLLKERAPVIRGELGHALERARIARAQALVGCSEDNLANLEACLRANPLVQSESPVRTVARIFDEEDVVPYLEAWGVHENLAAVVAAADAFVEGALFTHVVRPFRAPGGEASAFVGIRWPARAGVSLDSEAWQALADQGVRAVAQLGEDGTVERVPHTLDGLTGSGDTILIGPRAVLEPLIARLEAHATESLAAALA